ncbi:MAG: hypothetical protein Sv326_1004 [Candidatus Fermentimicrarchaeum limneticum]|uniref:Uncharacterized protein n=1 Tax=Fermentimicrarchaeum limneticum TaxID=2795018 RepID=A0A7D6BCK2_FERL1|nr:MAG: hypothetical protein Sv326_1004 [Candidatus Fermentimicrarchaeum limneticum]
MASEFDKIIARLDKEKTTGAFEHAADELISFITDDSTVGRVSDTFRKSESVWVRYGILKAYEMMDHAGSTAYRTLSQHCREVILEDLLVGLADKDKGIRMTSSDILSNGEELMKGAKPELGERIVKGLIANSDRARESSVVEALGVADYSGISQETKKQAADFLVKAAVDGSRNAARGVDRIGDEASKDIVRKHWLPKLDSRKEKEVGRALGIFEFIECKEAANKVDGLVKKGKRDSDYIDVLVRSGDERHEDSMIKLMEGRDWMGGRYCIADMEILGKKGWKKSSEILNRIVKNKKDYDEQEIEAARKASKEIEGRMTVSSKPAEKKLEEAMKRKKVPA